MFFAFALSTNVVFAENDKISESEISSIELNNSDNDNKVSTKLKIAEKEFSVHAGFGYHYEAFGFTRFDDDFYGDLSFGAKYKYKPFEKYDIRLLGEVDILLSFEKYIPLIIPISVGLDYEYRINENLSIWGDFGLGFTVFHSDYSDEIGASMVYELGVKYKNYSFSINSVKAYEEFEENINISYTNFRFGFYF